MLYAREFTPPVKRSSWDCPFSDCDAVSNRLADHLVAKHNLKGAVWKPFRHRLLRISKENDDNLYQEEVDMLEGLVGKVEDFQGDSILFEAGLRSTDRRNDVSSAGMGPRRVFEEEGLYTNIYEEAERVFVDAQPDLNSLMEHMKRTIWLCHA